jgi:RNA 2',3'-cyclic 3'-phosphodiesterase
MRTFLAIDLPLDIRNQLRWSQDRFREQLRSGYGDDPGIRWTHPDGIHLTLKFLGETSQEQSDRITESLGALGPLQKFVLEIRGYGFFPNTRQPQVFWAGIEAPPELAGLANRIERALAGLGLAERPFAPHLTLARLKTPRSPMALITLVSARKDESLGRFDVSEFFLFESQLSPGKPPHYRKIARFPLL